MKQSDYPAEILERIVLVKPKTPGPDDGSECNDTIPKQIVEIVHLPKVCDDCGVTAVDRQVQIKKYISPCTHWKIYCLNCSMYKDPISGEFSLKQSEINSHYRNLARAEKQASKLDNDK